MLLWTALIAIVLDVAFKVVDYNFLSTDEANLTRTVATNHTDRLNSNVSSTTHNMTNLIQIPGENDGEENPSLTEQENKEGKKRRNRRSISTLKIINETLKRNAEGFEGGIYRIQNKYARVLLTIKVKQEICIAGCSDGFPPNWQTLETFEITDSKFQRSLSANFNLTKIVFKTQLWKIIPKEKSKDLFNIQPVASTNIFTDSQNLIDFIRTKNRNHKDNGLVEEQDNFQSSFIPWNQSWIVKPVYNNNMDEWNQKSRLRHHKIINYTHGKVTSSRHYEIHTHIPGKCVNVNGDGYIGACREDASSWRFIHINPNN